MKKQTVDRWHRGARMTENKKALYNEDYVPTDIIALNNGFVKLFRSFKYWEWYKDANTMRLFLHCLLSANHSDKKWQGKIIHAGSFVTGRLKLAQELNLSERKIRTALNHLKTTNEVTIQSTSQYSIITVHNWGKFQTNDQQLSQQTTNQRPSNDQQTTTNKNNKNIRNNIVANKNFKKPSIEEIKNYCLERGNNINPVEFFDYYESTGWMRGKNKMKDWKAAVRTWEANAKKFKTPDKEDGIDYASEPYNPYR